VLFRSGLCRPSGRLQRPPAFQLSDEDTPCHNRRVSRSCCQLRGNPVRRPARLACMHRAPARRKPSSSHLPFHGPLLPDIRDRSNPLPNEDRLGLLFLLAEAKLGCQLAVFQLGAAAMALTFSFLSFLASRCAFTLPWPRQFSLGFDDDAVRLAIRARRSAFAKTTCFPPIATCRYAGKARAQVSQSPESPEMYDDVVDVAAFPPDSEANPGSSRV